MPRNVQKPTYRLYHLGLAVLSPGFNAVRVNLLERDSKAQAQHLIVAFDHREDLPRDDRLTALLADPHLTRDVGTNANMALTIRKHATSLTNYSCCGARFLDVFSEGWCVDLLEKDG